MFLRKIRRFPYTKNYYSTYSKICQVISLSENYNGRSLNILGNFSPFSRRIFSILKIYKKKLNYNKNLLKILSKSSLYKLDRFPGILSSFSKHHLAPTITHPHCPIIFDKHPNFSHPFVHTPLPSRIRHTSSSHRQDKRKAIFLNTSRVYVCVGLDNISRNKFFPIDSRARAPQPRSTAQSSLARLLVVTRAGTESKKNVSRNTNAGGWKRKY